MNRDLNRLVSRRLGTGEVQSLQPMVRSASPISEHDQRIGMAGFQGSEFTGPLMANAGSEAADCEWGDAAHRSVSRSITGISSTGEATTVQRKMVNSNDASTAPIFGRAPSIASAVKARPMHKNQRVIPSLDQSGAHLSSEVSRVAKQNKQFDSSESDTGIAVELAETSKTGHLQPEGSRQHHHHGATHDRIARQTYQQPDVPYLGPSPRVIAEHKEATSEDGNTRTKDTLAETSNAGHLQPKGSRQHYHRGAAHAQSAWQTHQQPDAPDLEPSPRAFPEHGGAASEDASTPRYEVDERPRIVIGRVNVEVVPPSVTQPSTAPQPGPLTAASVSVIGPLGDGASVSRRLSLRYR